MDTIDGENRYVLILWYEKCGGVKLQIDDEGTMSSRSIIVPSKRR